MKNENEPSRADENNKSAEKIQQVVQWFQSETRTLRAYENADFSKLIDSFSVSLHGGKAVVVSSLCNASGWSEEQLVNWSARFSKLRSRVLPKMNAYADGLRLTDIKHEHRSNRFQFVFELPSFPPTVRVDSDYQQLRKLIRSRTVKRAVLLQHSGMTTVKLRTRLLEMGTTVELFIQHPDAACNKAQSSKVEGMAMDAANYHGEHSFGEGAELLVYQYMVPATIRGVLIDDNLLSVGWYTYHQKKGDTKVDGWQNIQGDNRPSIIVSKGSAEFEPLYEMFQRVMDDVRKYSVQLPVINADRE